MILSFSLLARDVDPFQQPTIEGTPSVHMPISDSHNRPVDFRHLFTILKAYFHPVVSSNSSKFSYNFFTSNNLMNTSSSASIQHMY
jgi:hypothetical protein